MGTSSSRGERVGVGASSSRASGVGEEDDLLDAEQAQRLAPVPDDFLCPILRTIMKEPVLTVDGFTYEREAIEQWFRQQAQQVQQGFRWPAQSRRTAISPCTGSELRSTFLIPNTALRNAIESYLKARPEIARAVLTGRSVEEAAKALQQEVLEKNDRSEEAFRRLEAHVANLVEAFERVAPLVAPMPICLIFPGNRSLHVGMMQDLKDLPSVKNMLDKANDILGYDVLDIMLNGPEEDMYSFQYRLPAGYIADLAAAEKLKVDDPSAVARCQAVAGVEAGEYAALTVAGVFDFETGLRLVKAQANVVVEGEWRDVFDLFVDGLAQEQVHQLCEEVVGSKPGEHCRVSEVWSSTYCTVTGTKAPIDALWPKAEAAGPDVVVVLDGPRDALQMPHRVHVKDHMIDQLRRVKSSMRPPRCHVYMNATGKAVGPSSPVDDIIEAIGDQLVNPLLWHQSISQAVHDGCQTFIECGGKAEWLAQLLELDHQDVVRTRHVMF